MPIIYKENNKLVFEQVLELYESVEWTNYTQQSERLSHALSHSLYILAAYDQDELVGLIRVVGDGYTIVFIQDILVKPSHQRQGIGRQLLIRVLEQFHDVYQLHLLTDHTDKTIQFYQSLGFRPVSDINCLAFTYLK